MDRAELLDALGEVADGLSRRRASARVYVVVGGAAMALAYDADRATRDVDAVILDDHGAVIEVVRDVARRRGLPTTWLNEQAAAYIPRGDDHRQIVVFDHPSLRVLAASPERLLAMKARAARLADRGDIARLAELVGVTNADDVATIVAGQFPDEPWPERSRKTVEDILGG
ncbi:MAG TPA: DUF6036 family nucleotidyltransferase [Ilumatobacter sp.]|nr:DUF6036 family nucleotidyltransferase [Ilumatobacter sp.]